MSERTKAIERARNQGCGVLTICHLGVWTIGPSESVPYGELHEYLSMNDWYAGRGLCLDRTIRRRRAGLDQSNFAMAYVTSRPYCAW